MADLYYEYRKKNRFELRMNRKEVQELVLACQRWQLYQKAGSASDGILNSVGRGLYDLVVDQIDKFLKDEKEE